MSTLSDPILKYTTFSTNPDNNTYRSVHKLTPKEAGLTPADIKKYLSKLNIQPITKEPLVGPTSVVEISSSAKLNDSIINPDEVSSHLLPIDGMYRSILSHTETSNLIRKTENLRKKYSIKNRQAKIKKWYFHNRYSVTQLFKKTMYMMIAEDFEFTECNKELYDRFVEYCYDNYLINHI